MEKNNKEKLIINAVLLGVHLTLTLIFGGLLSIFTCLIVALIMRKLLYGTFRDMGLAMLFSDIKALGWSIASLVIGILIVVMGFAIHGS